MNGKAETLTEQVSFTLRGRNPDVPTCIANLSNDEVFTPPEFANRMMDLWIPVWRRVRDNHLLAPFASVGKGRGVRISRGSLLPIVGLPIYERLRHSQ